MEEQIPLLLGVLPTQLISSLVPERFKLLRTIDFVPGGKIMPGVNFPRGRQPGRICRMRQNLPGAPGK
jgi:hypothetical protein